MKPVIQIVASQGHTQATLLNLLLKQFVVIYYWISFRAICGELSTN